MIEIKDKKLPTNKQVQYSESATVADSGKIVVISAPSGAGKTSLARAYMAKQPLAAWSVSHTTRTPRPGEVDGVDYHFVSAEEFRRMITDNAFFEHAEVYGNHYGTARAAIERQLAEGKIVLLDIDWQGARNVRRAHPDAISIFIMPPDIASLESRLRGRGQDSDQVIAQRLAAAEADMRHAEEFEHVVVNDEFDRALCQFAAIIEN